MKKLNNKGFMLGEVLAVAVVVMVIFVAIFSTYLPATADIENRLTYNDVSSTYSAFYMRKLYLNETLSVGTNGYTELYNSTSGCLGISDGQKKAYCTALAKELGIESMVLSTYNTNDLKSKYNSGVLKNYIGYLPKYKNSLYNVGNYWKLISCSGSTCETRDEYRLQNSHKEYLFDGYAGGSCTDPLDEHCETKSGYMKEERNIISTIPDDNDPFVTAILSSTTTTYELTCTDTEVGDSYVNSTDWLIKCTPMDIHSVYDEVTVYTDWGDWGNTTCNISQSYCQKRTLYRDNIEVYRLLIKTKTGYANTEIKVNPKDDGTGALCSFEEPTHDELSAGQASIFTMNCIDFSGFYNSAVSANDFEITGNLENPSDYLSVLTVSRVPITSGFKYEILVTASTTPLPATHLFKITLNANVISDIFGNMNGSFESSTIKVGG